MQKRYVILALAAMPVLAAAQATATANASAKAEARFTPPAHWSAAGKAKLEAMYDTCEMKGVPREPVAKRVAEGEAKGASEASILKAAGKVRMHLEESHDAMVAAGRSKPSDEETERGAQLMERGMTKAQVETVTKHTPSDRSLVVAFDVLSRLAARGVPVDHALAQVTAKLDARESDEAILSLAGKSSTSAGAAGTYGTPVKGAVGATTSATGTGAVTGASKGIGAGVTGTVTGVVKKP